MTELTRAAVCYAAVACCAALAAAVALGAERPKRATAAFVVAVLALLVAVLCYCAGGGR